MSLEMFLLCLF